MLENVCTARQVPGTWHWVVVQAAELASGLVGVIERHDGQLIIILSYDVKTRMLTQASA